MSSPSEQSASACSSRCFCLNFMLPWCMMAPVSLYTEFFSSWVKPSTSKALYQDRSTRSQTKSSDFLNQQRFLWIFQIHPMPSSQAITFILLCPVKFWPLLYTSCHVPYYKCTGSQTPEGEMKTTMGLTSVAISSSASSMEATWVSPWEMKA